MTTVVIADDQGMVRAGLRSLLEGEDDLTVVAEAANGEQALHSVRKYKPDVVLMDIRMPHLDGLAATKRLVESGSSARILVLTTYDLDEYVFGALRAGASGFLLKDGPAEELISAIRAVAGGDSMLAPSATRRLIEAFAQVPDPEAPAELSELSEREREVLDLLARGMSNAEIADQLIVGASTIKTHVSSILSKLGLRDRVQAVIFAYESGLVRIGQAEGKPQN